MEASGEQQLVAQSFTLTVTLRAVELADVLLAAGRAHVALAVRLAAREVSHVLAPVGPPLPPGAVDLAAVELACGAQPVIALPARYSNQHVSLEATRGSEHSTWPES